MLEKTFLLKILKKAPSALSRVYSLTLILFGWWLFAFDNMSEGVAYLGKMFGAAPATSGAVNFDAISCIVLAVILVVASTPLPKKLYHKLYDRYAAARWVSFALSMGAMLICTAYLVNSSYNPFLYFRF